MISVEIYKVTDYQEELIERAIKRIFDKRPHLISRGDRVLIKPNLLAPTPSEKAVVTHPLVVKAVVKEVLERGGKPVVGDSPALNSASKVAKACGLTDVLKELSVPLIEFDDRVEVKSDGFIKRLEVTPAILEFDKVINLPKFKTHGQMILTLAVKNMFGVIPGKLKGEWHVKAAQYENFARMLVSVYLVRQPDLNVIDAVVGMEGNGPQNGRPVEIGYLMASEDGFALDEVGARMVGVEKVFYVLNAAEELGLRKENIKIEGDEKKIPFLEGFTLPASTPVAPEVLRRIIRSGFPKPSVIKKKCEACGLCVEACPTGAMNMAEKARVDYSKCISCFVCQEVCPFDAIKIKTGLLGTIFRKLF